MTTTTDTQQPGAQPTEGRASIPWRGALRARNPVCIAGVDLGAHSAKIVLAAAHGNRQEILAAARLVFPEDAMSDTASAVAAITGWMREWCSMPVRSVVCSLPSRLTEYETAVIPSNHQDLEGAATDALSQMLGSDAAKVTCDYWSTPRDLFGEQADTLHLVWTSGEGVHRIPLEFSKLHVACGVLEATPSLLGGVAHLHDGAARLVADLGHETTTFVLVENGQTMYARHRASIPSGDVVDGLARDKKLARSAAETLLADWGIAADSGVVGARITPHCEPWLQSLRFELDRTLAFLDHRNGGRGIHEVLLCGGASRTRGLGEWLTERIGVTTRPADLPERCVWSAVEPYSPLFAQAVALLQGEAER